MTTAQRAKQRTRPRPSRADLSLLRQSSAYRETPDYLSSCVHAGTFVTCPTCKRVIGVGTSAESAIRDSLNNGTGIRHSETGQVFCTDHAGENES